MRVFRLRNIFLLIAYLIGKKEAKNYRAYEIKEESMSPNLLPGEYIFAKLAKLHPNRGDIVIFENNEKKFDVVKRVLGLPGEKYQLRMDFYSSMGKK